MTSNNISADCPYCNSSCSINSSECLYCNGEHSSGLVARPWVRYWARYLDMHFYIVVILALSLPLFIIIPDYVNQSPFLPVFLLLYLCCCFVLSESFLIFLFGTTPGKWLFKTKLSNLNGQKLGFQQALKRTFKVWLKGEGLCIPLVSLFTLCGSYSNLADKKITSWDKEGGHIVLHQKIGFLRIIFGIILIIIMALLASAVKELAP